MKPAQLKLIVSIALSAALLTSSTNAPAGRISERTAAELHLQAWDQNLDSAGTVPAARFGFYSHRSLAVQHPEVYLQADQLISEALEDLPGSSLAYRSPDPRDVILYLRLARREMKGGGFDWGMMTITPDSIYDVAPMRIGLDWLDLRAPSVGVLLKSASPRLSTLESALLRYSQLTQRGYAPEDLFVVVDRKGVGYLASDSLLWTAGLSERQVKNRSKVSPVLVFNRQSVFSALSGRDDRNSNPLLSTVMSRLGNVAKLSLNSEDSKQINRLSVVTTLADSTAHRLAVLVASGLIDRKQPIVEAAWTTYLRAANSNSLCETPQIEEATFWGNRLSPLAATLADELKSVPLADGLSSVQGKYLSWTGRRVQPSDSSNTRVEAWGCIWSYDLLVTSLDDNARTRSGSSLSQALAMSSILDLAGIEHFQLAVQLGDRQVPDQQWLFTDGGRYQYNFGVWTAIPDTIQMGQRISTLVVSGFSLRGRPVRIVNQLICSQMDDLSVSEQLTKIARQIPLASLSYISPSGEVTTFQKLLMELSEDKFQSVSPSWPPAPTQ